MFSVSVRMHHPYDIQTSESIGGFFGAAQGVKTKIITKQFETKEEADAVTAALIAFRDAPTVNHVDGFSSMTTLDGKPE